VFCMASTLSFIAEVGLAQQTSSHRNTGAEKNPAVKRFEKRLKEYTQVRERLSHKLPHISKEATPEQIEARKTAFAESVRRARANSKPGDLFDREIAHYIRTTIKSEFKGTDRKEIRKTILEAETKGVPIRVNYPYPDTKELAQVPATVLLKLPELPRHLKYRFVGRHLLLVDRENDLILDYVLNALP
jgi:hypothetical protein